MRVAPASILQLHAVAWLQRCRAVPRPCEQVDFLRERDKQHNRIVFVDISAADYSPDANAGISFEQARSPRPSARLRAEPP